MSFDFIFGSSLADLTKRYLLLWLLRSGWFYIALSRSVDISFIWLLGIPLPWLLDTGTTASIWLIDAILMAVQIQTLWQLIQRMLNRNVPPDDRKAGRRRFAKALFGIETRIRPLITTLAVITTIRIGWIAINTLHPKLQNITMAFLPWPSGMHSIPVFMVELALAAYQLRALLRLARALLLHYAPHLGTRFEFSVFARDDGQNVTPRNRSWIPTALQFCALLTLTCCALTWITLMLWYRVWVPFDYFMRGNYAEIALYVGLGLSFLGFLFGGRYIFQASSNISTSFGVTPVADDHWLAERVHHIAEKLNLPKPAVGTMNVMNAYAIGSNPKTAMVVIGQPLFCFEKDELDAIIGHELGHILHKDVARMQFAEGFQQMLVRVINTLTVFGAILAASAAKSRAGAQMGNQIALGSGALVRRTVFIASELLAKGISRNREFHADAVGAHVTTPAAMASALKRVHGIVERPSAEEHHYGYLMFRGAGFGRLLSTHPSLDARLKALDAHVISRENVQFSKELETVLASEGIGVSIAAAHVSSVAYTKASKFAIALVERTRRFYTLRNLRMISIVAAVCGIVAVAIPAMVDFYGLDRRLSDAKSLTTQAWTSSRDWAVQTKEAALATLIPTISPSAPETTNTVSKVELDEARQVAGDLQKENVDLQNQLAVLKAENTGLANRVREQAKTITDWTAERIIDRQKMQGYEQQIALQEIKLKEVSAASSQPSSNVPPSYWVAAAVNSRGNVEIVTQIRDRDEAQRQALAKCGRTGSGCRFIGSYENACVSIARPLGHPILPGNFWHAGDASRYNAEKRAVLECNRSTDTYCKVALSFCASDSM